MAVGFLAWIAWYPANVGPTKGEVALSQIAFDEAAISGDTSAAYLLMKDKCFTCHSPEAQSHDDLIAPPMIAIKRRYTRMYSDREDFIQHIVDWAKDPKEENAIMRGAVARFKIMPYMNFEEEELTQIATYIYDHEIEQPIWFEEHYRQMHPQGRRGRGMRKK